MVAKPRLPMSESEIITQVQQERQLWVNFVDQKRQLFLERLQLYTNIADQWGKSDKVYVRTIRSTMQTLMSLYYSDQITVNFAGRQLWDDELADNYNNLAEFDYEEMDMEKLTYDVQWNRLFYWVGIRIFDHWDEVRNVPVYRSIDPISWIPDPLGYIDNYRFHWFELEVDDSDLTTNIYFNVDKITPSESEREQRRRNEIQQSRQTNWGTPQTENQPIYWIYNHYTTIKGKKYLVTLANDQTLLIRFEEINPVYEEEKKDNSLIKYPVIINHYEPFKGDPFGICVPDLLEDKQKIEQLFLNLNRIKAEHEAWGDTFLVDTSAIKNLNDLRQHTQWPKYVRADLQKNPNPIKEVQRGTIKQDAYSMAQIIRQQGSNDMGLDERAIGWTPDKSITATENQRIQRNQNVKLVLNNKINQWWEKDFWRDWLREYYQFFPFNGEKNIMLQNSFGNVIQSVKRKDIDTWANIDVKIINKSEEEAMKEQEKAGLLVVADLVLQDPTSPTISKTFAKRSIARAQWLSKDKVSVLFPSSVEEMSARMDLELLNRDRDVNEIEDLQEDHMTYIVVYGKAMDTDSRDRAIQARKEAMILSGQSRREQAPGQWGWVLWSSAAQFTNAAIQGNQQQGASSIADVVTQ